MSKTFDPRFDARDDEPFFGDDNEFIPTLPWSLDELEHSADLGSVRSACAGCGESGDY